jgi:hypothetical protein
MDMALAMVENAFKGTTVAEVLSEPSDSIPLCPFPPLHNSADPDRAWALNRMLGLRQDSPKKPT